MNKWYALTQESEIETHVRAFLTALQSQDRYSRNTILGYQNDLQHFTRYLYQHLGRAPQVTDVNADRVLAYLKSGLRTNKPSTIKRRMATMKHFAQFLQLTGGIEVFQFPATEQIFSPYAEPSRAAKISSLSDLQVSTLFDLLRSDLRPQARRDETIFSLILEVGLSASRLGNLDLSDFDPQRSILQLRKASGENWCCQIEKSGPFLKRYLLEGRPELNPVPGESALFISQMGQRVSRQGIWQICQRWGEKASFPKSLSPRVLRHTSITRMVKAGYSAQSIQEILEHNNLRATQGLLQRICQAESILTS